MTSLKPTTAGRRVDANALTRGLTFLACAAVVVTFVRNFWINEDAYILFRSLEQLAAGNGPVWNPDERVQVYTSVAWYWLLALLHLVLRDVVLSTALLSTVMLAICVYAGSRCFRSGPILFAWLSSLLLSRAFFDYTSSGLENVLGYAVVACLYAVLTRGDLHSKKTEWQVAAITSLVPLVRHDLLVSFIPALSFVMWTLRKDPRALLRIMSSALPLVLWTAFSLLYYGMPLPNTAYAKLNHGYPQAWMWELGFRYVISHYKADPFTLLMCLLAPFVAPRGIRRMLAIGVLLQLGYVCYAGGDYMMGRFLGLPFLLASLVVADALAEKARSAWVLRTLFVLACSYAAWLTEVPVRAPLAYGKDADLPSLFYEFPRSGLLDSRAVHYATSFIAYARGEAFKSGVLAGMRADGEYLRWRKDPLVVRGAVGATGYYAGLDIHIVDWYALTDPFLSRLPAIRRFANGHFEREIVDGYLSRLADGKTRLADKKLDRYYREIELIAYGQPLLSERRLRAILEFNLRRHDALLQDYRRRVMGSR